MAMSETPQRNRYKSTRLINKRMYTLSKAWNKWIDQGTAAALTWLKKLIAAFPIYDPSTSVYSSQSCVSYPIQLNRIYI